MLLIKLSRGHILGVEDFVLPVGEGGHRQNEPGLVGEVLLGHVDAAGNADLSKVLQVLLHHHELGRRFCDLAVDDVSLFELVDRARVHHEKGLLVYELTAQLGHGKAVSSHEFVEGGHVLQGGATLAEGGGALRRHFVLGTGADVLRYLLLHIFY